MTEREFKGNYTAQGEMKLFCTPTDSSTQQHAFKG